MLFTPLYSYAWMSGHGIALVNLRNVESDIGAFNRRTTGDGFKRVNIQAQPVDDFPVRRTLDDGNERGDGVVNHQWQMILTTLGYKYVLDTYLSSGAVVSVPMTINTRAHRLGIYKRYSCNLTLLSRAKGTERLIRQNVWELTFEFTNLIVL